MDDTQLERLSEKQAQKDFFDNVAAYQGKLYDASATYNQVIVLAGYAAYFGVWSANASSLPKWLSLMSGGLMLVSVVVYVAWTVVNMVVMKLQIDRMLAEIREGPDNFVERVQAVEVKGVQAVADVMRYWKPVVWVAGVTAFLAASLLAAGSLAASVSLLM